MERERERERERGGPTRMLYPLSMLLLLLLLHYTKNVSLRHVADSADTDPCPDFQVLVWLSSSNAIVKKAEKCLSDTLIFRYLFRACTPRVSLMWK